MNPFEFVKSINQTKINIIQLNAENESSYDSFLVNRSLSYFSDTVALANVMNQFHKIDSHLQYNFLLNTVRKRSRFSKWEKLSENEDINAVKEYYGYSNEKAREVIKILSQSNLNEIKQKVYKGGRK